MVTWTRAVIAGMERRQWLWETSGKKNQPDLAINCLWLEKRNQGWVSGFRQNYQAEVPVTTWEQVGGRGIGRKMTPTLRGLWASRWRYKIRSWMWKLGVQMADKADCFPPAGYLLPCQRWNPQRREKIGQRTLNSMRSFKNHKVRQRKGRSGRGGKLTKGQSHNKCHFLNKLRRKIKSMPTKLKPTSAGSVTTASKPTEYQLIWLWQNMDTKWFCRDGSRFLFSSGISAATSVPISQCLTNQALSNKSDVKLVGGGYWERGEGQQWEGAMAPEN